MATVIDVKNLKKKFKDITAVDGISFQVEKGELFGFLGINGAGKSTTINMLCTLYPATSGEAEICGYQLGRQDEAIRRQIGVVYQNNCLDERMNVRENLFFRGSFYEPNHRRLKEKVLDVCAMLELEDVYEQQFSRLSGGQKRRCEIARALLNTPEVLFLDEPTTGLDPATRKKVWRCIDKLRCEMNTTVFLTTHYMEEAARASNILIIDAGQIKEYGTPFGLKEQYAKDKLRLVVTPEKREMLKAVLSEQRISYREKDEYLVVSLRDSMQALPLLKTTETFIEGFEVVQGSMDDVFLNVTGKVLEG